LNDLIVLSLAKKKHLENITPEYIQPNQHLTNSD